MNCDYSAYEGWEVTGKIDTVLLRGKVGRSRWRNQNFERLWAVYSRKTVDYLSVQSLRSKQSFAWSQLALAKRCSLCGTCAHP
jgi:hypothetical protein